MKEPNLEARRSERESVCAYLTDPRTQKLKPRDLANKIWRGVHLGLPDNGKPLLPVVEPKSIEISI